MRKELSEILERVAFQQESVIVERNGRPMCALIPFELFVSFERYLDELEDKLDLDVARKTENEDTIRLDDLIKHSGG